MYSEMIADAVLSKCLGKSSVNYIGFIFKDEESAETKKKIEVLKKEASFFEGSLHYEKTNDGCYYRLYTDYLISTNNYRCEQNGKVFKNKIAKTEIVDYIFKSLYSLRIGSRLTFRIKSNEFFVSDTDCNNRTIIFSNLGYKDLQNSKQIDGLFLCMLDRLTTACPERSFRYIKAEGDDNHGVYIVNSVKKEKPGELKEWI